MGVCALLAIVWLVEEALISVATIDGIFLPELWRRFVDAIPAQLALFGAAGLVLGAWSHRTPLSPYSIGWCALGTPTLVLLGSRILEGLLRKSSVLGAALGGALLVACVVAALVGLARAGRRLAARSRVAWFWAVWVCWSMLVILFLQRAGWEIGRWQGGVSSWLGHLEGLEVACVFAIAACVFAVGVQRSSAVRLGGAAVLLVALVLVFAVRSVRPSYPASGRDAPDVLMIVFDTLRSDHVGMRRGGRSVTPALDALSRESVRFPNAYSPSNWTKASMPGIVASLPRGVTSEKLPDEVVTLAEHLHDAGWATYGISANPWVTARFGFAQGFDEFIDPNAVGVFLIANVLQVVGAKVPRASYRTGIVESYMYYRTAAELRERVVDFFDRSPGPSFAFLQIMDAHGPYLPPKELLPADFDYSKIVSYYDFMALSEKGVLNSEGFRPKLENLRDRYAAGVHYGDAELGKLFDALRARGRWDETVVWIVSDHGEAFGEHDYAAHSGWMVSDTLIRVPLMLKPAASWKIAPRREAAAASMYSLLPTTLGLLGLEDSRDGLYGVDLSGLVRSGPGAFQPGTLIAESFGAIAAIRWPWKLVVRRPVTREERVLYQLENDPGELSDVAAQHPQLVAELDAEIMGWLHRVKRESLQSESHEIDAETAEQLRKLGYGE